MADPTALARRAAPAAAATPAGSPCSGLGTPTIVVGAALMGLARRSFVGTLALTTGGLALAELVAHHVEEPHAPVRSDPWHVCAAAVVWSMGAWAVGRAVAE